MLIGFEQNQLCDSILSIAEEQINEYDHQIYLLKEIVDTDSLRLMLKDEIIDMADKETRKQKRLKILSIIGLFLSLGIGIVF